MEPNDCRPLVSDGARKARFGVIFLVAAIAVLGVIGFAISRLSKPAQHQGGVVEKVTIAQAGDFFLYAPLYVALDSGIFHEEGLDVSLITTGGDEKTWAAVVSGSAQFGVADPTFVAISSARGQPGRVVSSIVNGVPFWG